MLATAETTILLTFVLVTFVFMFGFFALLSSMIHICAPNEVLVLTGRRHVAPDGTLRGYRVIKGGRVLRVPMLENCQRLELRPPPVKRTLKVMDAKGQQQTLLLEAEVRVIVEDPGLNNAIERFLGQEPADMSEVAANTLESHVRLLAGEREGSQLTTGLSGLLAETAESDLAALGLEAERVSLSLA